MAETFLILFAGGVLLAGAVSDPRAVTLRWLRLGGIIALALVGVGLVFYVFMREGGVTLPQPLPEREGSMEFFRRIQVGLLVGLVLAILGQLAFVQVAWRRTQRLFAVAGFVVAVLAGANLLHEMMIERGTAEGWQTGMPALPEGSQAGASVTPKWVALVVQGVACAGVAAMTGVALMDMLLGHGYLTAGRMGIGPFRRLNLVLAGVVGVRLLTAVGLVLLLHAWRPVTMLWGLHGLLIVTRWVVGLGVAGVFIYMADDCIRRRSTQSATGILYVAGVLIVIGEMIGLWLVRETGLPF